MSAEINFGNWLKQRRKERGITPDTLAERIDCSTITLFKIEAGERRPSRQIALLLARFFAIPEDEHEAFIAFARAGQSNTPASAGPTAAGSTPTPAASVALFPWRTAKLRRTNLPHTLTSLLGRARELEEATGLLMQSRVRLVTLTGAPGIGKTSLALRLAAGLLDYFDDGVFLVGLAAVDDPEQLLPSVARTLGLKETGGRSIEEVLLDHLRERRILLVLDNFEHLLDAALIVIKLLESSPWLKVLATSREALHVRGERRFPLQPLGTPDLLQPLDLQTLATYPSVQLFVYIAQAANPSFALDAGNMADVAAVCVALEGLPLAIELAAARVDYLSPSEMRHALGSRLTLLTGGARDLPARQRTLRSAIEWSYSLLGAEERLLFRSLAVFVDGFTPAAAQALWDEAHRAGEEGLASVLDILEALEGKSLLKRESSGAAGGLRFGLLETIREYAREKLWQSEQPGEAEHVQRQHALYFLHFGEKAGSMLEGPEQVEWYDQLEREYGNLRAALAWSLGRGGDAQTALRLSRALWRYWWTHGRAGEGREWLALALARGQTEPAGMRAPALAAIGTLAWAQGDYTAARAFHEEGLALQRGLEDKAGIAAALNNLGIVLRAQGDYSAARAALEESLALRRELGDRHGMAASLNNLGVLARSLDDQTAAGRFFAETLALWREVDNKAGIALSLNNLGLVASEQGDYAAAIALHEEALALHRQLGNAEGVADSHHHLGIVAQEQGDHATAAAYFAQALDLYRKTGSRSGVGTALKSLGEAIHSQGDSAAARALLDESLTLFRQMGEQGSVADGLRWQGIMLQLQGDHAAASVLLEESLAILRELDDKRGIGHLLNSLGHTAYMQGAYEEARLLFGECLSIKRAFDDKSGIAMAVTGLGAVEIASGYARRGARLLGLGAALRDETRKASPSADPLVAEHATAAATAMLGEEEFRQAWAEGSALSAQETLASALDQLEESAYSVSGTLSTSERRTNAPHG